MFKDESLKNYRKLNKQYKEKELRERILKKGALYPGTFNNENGKPAFDKNNRISLLLYSQNPELKNKFLSKSLKKIMQGKKTMEKDGVKPGQYFNNRSIQQIYSEDLSQETSKLGSIVVSNKYKSPVKEFLRDLDEMVYDQQHSYESLNVHLQPNQDLSKLNNQLKVNDSAENIVKGQHIIDSSRSRKFTADSRKYSHYSSVPKNKITIKPTDKDQIGFLRMKPFHVNISRAVDLSQIETEIFNDLVKIRKDQLLKLSHQMFKGQDPLVRELLLFI